MSETAHEIAHTAHETHTPEHHHSDTVTVPVLGTITVYGGIYTVVFGILGVLTALEVLLAEVLPSGTAKILALVAIGIAKAVLVVMFYMHLKDDDRLLTVVLGLPLFITVLSCLYLLAIPPTGYGG